MLSCRFYAEECPKLGEIVVGKPVRITDLCAYVQLLEYDNLEAMLTIGELSRRRIRSINKLLRVGRMEYLQVIRVNETTRCIDLSKSSVSSEDADMCRNLYSRAKTVNSILYRVAETLNYGRADFENLYQKTAWQLDMKHGSKKTSSLDVFASAIKDRSKLDELDIDERTKAILLESIHLKLGKKNVKIGAVIEVTCFEKDGIDAIKDALRAGLTLGTDDVPVKINLIAPPAFNVIVIAIDQDDGIKLLGTVLETVRKKIEEYKGSLKIVSKPKQLSEQDEKDIETRLLELELQNVEKPGDNESDDEDYELRD